MRFNTDRRNQLAFDDVAVDYRARPDVPAAVVDWCLEAAPVGPDEAVLEVGAGTGQLTSQLLEHGIRITAVEPGARLRAALASRFAGEKKLTVAPDLFEHLSFRDLFSGIWSANAFHWVDPERAYSTAHRALQPGRSLVLIWTFLLVADTAIAAELRRPHLGGDLINFAPISPGSFIDNFHASAADGRAELGRSGLFGEPVWRMTHAPFEVSAEDYAALVLSFANAAAAPDHRCDDLRTRAASDLHGIGIDTIVFDQHAYALIATAL